MHQLLKKSLETPGEIENNFTLPPLPTVKGKPEPTLIESDFFQVMKSF